MNKDLQLVCLYKNNDGSKLQRTFWISEIIANEHLNFLVLAHGYEFIGFDYPEYR